MTLRNQYVRPEDLFRPKNRKNFGEDLFFFEDHAIIWTKLLHFLRPFWSSQNRKYVIFELAPRPRLALGASGCK